MPILSSSSTASAASAEDSSTSSSSLNEPLLPSQQLQHQEEQQEEEEAVIIDNSVSTITDDGSNDDDHDNDEEQGGYSSSRRRRRTGDDGDSSRRRRIVTEILEERQHYHSCCCCSGRSCIVMIVIFIILCWIVSIWFKPAEGSLVDGLPTFLFPTFLFPTINGDGGGSNNNNNQGDNTSGGGAVVTDSPIQIHLSYTNDPSVVLVQFTTAGTPKHPITPVAMYGIEEPTTKVDDATTTTYTASDMCTSPANLSTTSIVGQLHTIPLTNLQPSTYYNYKVGLTFGQGIVWSSLGSFPSPPTIGSNNQANYTFAVYGAGTYANLNEISFGSEIKSVHHLGNLVNASGDNTKWESYMTAISDKFASQIPMQVVIGNQDYDYSLGNVNTTTNKDPSGVKQPYHPIWGNYNSTFESNSGGECGVPISKRFTMPSSTQQSNGIFWYSYNVGTVHTIVLSTEHSLVEINSTQQEFLVNDLKQINRTITPWIIIEMHRSLYYPYNNTSTEGKDYIVGLNLRTELEDIFINHNVDLVLSGHAKSYSRSCQGLYKEYCAGPMYNNGTGPTYITVGGSSSSSTSSSSSDDSDNDNSNVDDNDDDDEIYIENNYTIKTIKSTFGYGKITVNSTNLVFEYIQGGTNSNNTILDEVVIKKK